MKERKVRMMRRKTQKKGVVPTSYWSYRYRWLNGERRYVRVRKDPVTGLEKIRMAKKRK